MRRTDYERAFGLAVEMLLRSNPSLRTWSEAFRIEEGAPLNFDLFPFQRELYDVFGDKAIPTVDVMKSGQCGISAAAVSLALYAGDRWDASVLYVLPGALDAYDFSDSRVAPAIDGSPYLAERFAGGTANKGLKRVGNAWLYFRGSVSEKKALSIPADILVLDEYDRLDQRNVPKFRKRLGSPKSLKLERRFSNPSIPEMGIHALYLDSDQREWLVRCAKCRHERPVHYEQDDDEHYVHEKRELRVCGKCARALPAEAIATGRWVAATPHVPRHGYQISKLIVPTQGMAELVKEHAATDEDSLQAHYNFDLGLPYSPKGGSLSSELVRACQRNYLTPDKYTGPDWVTAGVDVGRVLHVRISRWMSSGRAAPLFIGSIRGFNDLAELWERFGVNFGLIDERPEERAAREFANDHPGRVMLARWSGGEQKDDIVVDEKHRIVTARRTWACDQTVAAFASQMRLLPKIVTPTYVPQVTAVFRTMQETMKGTLEARYMSMRADHFFFAETYDLLAKLARGGAPAGGSSPPPKPLRRR
ncbi:MAG: terminase gpA endonuclease subunit [Actinomycetota bacterium]